MANSHFCLLGDILDFFSKTNSDLQLVNLWMESLQIEDLWVLEGYLYGWAETVGKRGDLVVRSWSGVHECCFNTQE